ncbi:MAG: hypothetical protein ABR548_04845 [Actinomycetota bacterium]|nr:hypothetical protein [Actinomycetota bacterium]
MYFVVFLPMLLVALAALAFNIWMLVDALGRSEDDFSSPGSRAWWIGGLAVGMLTSPIGLIVAIAYYAVVRGPATRRGRA